MSEHQEEAVRLPEALEGGRVLGKMVVRYGGYFQGDWSAGEGSRLLLDVVWMSRRYAAPMLLPLEGVDVDPALTQACEAFLHELDLSEGELEYRAGYLHKIDDLVEKAAKRLYKRLLKEKCLPVELRPKKFVRK